MKAALLDRNKNVIGEVFDAPKKGNTIEIAGVLTENGDAVNVKIYKISRSKKNLAKAMCEQPVTKIETNHSPVWTFHCVEDNQIVY